MSNERDFTLVDYFPRRNLPDGSENWGRAIEGRILEIEKTTQRIKQVQDSTIATAAAMLGIMGRQVESLGDLKDVKQMALGGPITARRNATDSSIDIWNPALPYLEEFTSATGMLRIEIDSASTVATNQLWFRIYKGTELIADPGFSQNLLIPSGSSGSRTWFQDVPKDTPLRILFVGRSSSGEGVLPSFTATVRSVPL